MYLFVTKWTIILDISKLVQCLNSNIRVFRILFAWRGCFLFCRRYMLCVLCLCWYSRIMYHCRIGHNNTLSNHLGLQPSIFGRWNCMCFQSVFQYMVGSRRSHCISFDELLFSVRHIGKYAFSSVDSGNQIKCSTHGCYPDNWHVLSGWPAHSADMHIILQGSLLTK